MKKRCYLLLLTMALCLLNLTVNAQEKARQQEIGLMFSNLDRFGITYRVGKNDKLWRYNLIQSDIRATESSDADRIWQTESFSIELGIGRETRKALSEDLQVRYGLDVTFGYSWFNSLNFGRNDSSNDSEATSTNMEVMINFVGGLNYQINDRLLLGVEVLPAFGIERGSRKEDFNNTMSEHKSTGYFVRMSNGGALLSLVYTF